MKPLTASYRRIFTVVLIMVVLAGTLPASISAQNRVSAQTMTYQEHPVLAQLVAEGLLPPVEQRLPAEPLVLETKEIGQYGGTANVYGTWAGLSDSVLLFGLASPFRRSPDGTGGFPALFTGYEVNDNYTEYVFHIRPGVKWSDGVELTSADFYGMWRYIMADPLIWGKDTDEVVIEDNAVTVTNETCIACAGRTVRKEVIDDYTIKYTSDKPYRNLIDSMSADHNKWNSMVRPMHFFNNLHPDFIGEEAANAKAVEAGFDTWDQLYNALAGWSGYRLFTTAQVHGNMLPTLEPYITVSVSETQVVYERNPYYWAVDTEGKQLPYIDRIVLNIVNDREIIAGHIIAGDADFAGFDNSILNANIYRENEENGGYTTTLWTSPSHALVIWPNFCQVDEEGNPTKLSELWLEKDFRRALNLSVPRARINNDIFFGLALEVRLAPRPESVPFYNEEWLHTDAQFDPDQATALLDGLGVVDADGDGWRDFPDGSPLSAHFLVVNEEAPKKQIFELLVAEWQAIGLNFTFADVPGSAYWPQWNSGLLPGFPWHGERTMPPDVYFDVHGAPGQASCYEEYYNTNGAAGREPPQNILDLWKAIREDMQVAATDEELKAAGTGYWARMVTEDWVIDTVANFPVPVIFKKDMGNVPTPDDGPLYWNYGMWWTSAYDPMTWFFKGRELITAEESKLPLEYSAEVRAMDPFERAISDPAPDPQIKPDHILLPEEVPDPSNPPPGCPFHTRCLYVIERCRIEPPAFLPASDDPGHFVACHRADQLTLQPAPHQHLAVRKHALDIESLRKSGQSAAGGNGTYTKAFEGDLHDN